jgi:hypothetical protein
VLSENTVVLHADDVILIILVMIIQVFQNFELNTCLILKLFLIPDNFNSNVFFGLMIKTLDSLTETALPQKFQYFISVSKMVL